MWMNDTFGQGARISVSDTERESLPVFARDTVRAALITSVAQGETGYDELADWFKQRLVRASPR